MWAIQQITLQLHCGCVPKNTQMRKVCCDFPDLEISFSGSSPGLWESVLTLRDHNADRRQADPNLWREKQEEKVASFVVNVCKMASNYDLVHRVMGILATNSANLDLPAGAEFGMGMALYPTYAKVNHSCFSNTKNLNHLPQHE